MGEARFEEAVQIARAIREQVETDLGTPRELFAKRWRAKHPDRQMELLATLVQCSAGIALTWDCLNEIAQHLLRNREPVPGPLADWLVTQLAGKPTRPKLPGQDPHANLVRNTAIVEAVQNLVLLPPRFRATRTKRLPMRKPPGKASVEGGSACDAVGVAFSMNYKAVEKVWTASANPTSPVARRPFASPPLTSYQTAANK